MNDSPLVVPPEQNSSYALIDMIDGRVHPLRIGSNRIGRSSKSQIILDDPAISRRHATLEVDESGECEIRDAGSRNGVRLHGERIYDSTRISLGDLIQLHDFRFLFVRQKATGPLLFTDESLGVVVRSEWSTCWYFGVGFNSGQFILAAFGPPGGRSAPALSPSAPEWDPIRRLYCQVKLNEATARVLIETQCAPGAGYVTPHLRRLLFTTESATFIYEHHAGTVCVTIDPSGTVLSGPAWILREEDDD